MVERRIMAIFRRILSPSHKWFPNDNRHKLGSMRAHCVYFDALRKTPNHYGTYESIYETKSSNQGKSIILEQQPCCISKNMLNCPLSLNA